jgi:alanyl-tRNA synthetase
MEDLRLIGIGDLDLNPCGGTHLQSIAEIQLLKIVGVEKDRGAQYFCALLSHTQYFRVLTTNTFARLLVSNLDKPASPTSIVLKNVQSSKKLFLKSLVGNLILST